MLLTIRENSDRISMQLKVLSNSAFFTHMNVEKTDYPAKE